MNQNAVKAISQDKDKKLRNAGLVFLYHEEGIKPAKLAQFCSLARTTIATYVRNFYELLDWAKEQFTKAKKKIVNQYWVYIDKITLQNGEVWCKIGQTTTTPEKRAQKIKNSGWKNNGQTIKPQSVEVQWAAKCKDKTAMEIMENILRIAMIKLNPDKFQKNDRLLTWEDDYPKKIYHNLQVQAEGQKYLTTTANVYTF